MHGLSRDVDLNFLIGREVIQVAIGVYQVILALDDDVTISVEAEFAYFDGHSDWSWKLGPGSAEVAAHTVALLGATIGAFENRGDGTLVLTFSNGHRLTIFDASKEYESYHITRPGETIVV